MVEFPNAEITIFREMKHGTIIGQTEGDLEAEPPIEPGNILLDCGVDGFDNIPHCLCEFTKVIGDFQPGASTETKKEFGDITQSLFTLYLDLGIDIRKEDKVKVVSFKGNNRYTGYYQVLGDPSDFSTLLPHIEVALMKERK